MDFIDFSQKFTTMKSMPKEQIPDDSLKPRLVNTEPGEHGTAQIDYSAMWQRQHAIDFDEIPSHRGPDSLEALQMTNVLSLRKQHVFYPQRASSPAMGIIDP